MTIFFDAGPIVVAALRKNGSQSIRHAFNKYLSVRERPIHQLPRGKPVITFVREPISRLRSAYQYFSRLGWPGDEPWRSYEGFIDGVLGGFKNEHWSPQRPQLFYGGKFLPTAVYRFENIVSVWTALGLPPIRKHNASEPANIDETYRRDEVDAFFADDIELWQHARSE